MKQVHDEIIETLKRFKDSIPEQINCTLDDIVPKKVNDIVQNTLDINEEFLKGPQGRTGPQGPRGFEGPQGLRGISIKSVSLEDNKLSLILTNGKIFHFEESLKGDKGDKGEQGDRGEKGVRGQRGKQGPRGESAPLQYQGEWRSDRRYKRGDIVSYGIGLYIALRDNSERPGERSTAWDLMISLATLGPKGGGGAPSSGAGVDQWFSGRFYPEHTVVTYNHRLYVSKQDHTSTVFEDDFNNRRWEAATLYHSYRVPCLNGATDEGITELEYSQTLFAALEVAVILIRKTDTEKIISRVTLSLIWMDGEWVMSEHSKQYIEGGLDGVTFKIDEDAGIIKLSYDSTTLGGTFDATQNYFHFGISPILRAV